MDSYVVLDRGLLARLRERTASVSFRFTDLAPGAAARHALHSDELLIVDPAMDAQAYELCRHLLRLRRSAGLLCYTRLSPEAVHRLTRLSRMGYLKVILFDYDDAPDALVAALADEDAQVVSRQVVNILSPRLDQLSGKLISVIQDLFRRPFRYCTVADLALAADVSSMYLYRGLRTAGLCSPKHLITTARMSRIAGAALHDDHSLVSASKRAGYRDQRVLRTECHRILRCSPHSLKLASVEQVINRLVAFASSQSE